MKVVVKKSAVQTFLKKVVETKFSENPSILEHCGCGGIPAVGALNGELPRNNEPIQTTVPKSGPPIEPVNPLEPEQIEVPRKLSIEKDETCNNEEARLRDVIRLILVKFFFQNAN